MNASKNINMSPFDMIAKLLSASSFRSTSFLDKMDFYFQDYSLIPLFVQENYIKMDPLMTREAGLTGKAKVANQIKLLSEAADSISDSDLLETAQRNENSWSLLPLHAALSTIRPCFFVHGNLTSTGSGFYGGGYGFPSWLGQYSKQSKGRRILRELQVHMRLAASADKDQVVLNYLPVLTKLLTDPLVLRDVEVFTVCDIGRCGGYR
jgi:replication factor C subunit 1